MGLLNALHLKLAFLVTTMAAALAAAETQTNPGYKNTCGNVSIPYPFGTSKNCYIDEKFLNYTMTTSPSSSGEAATQLIWGENVKVVSISLDPLELTVFGPVSKLYYYSSNISLWYAIWFDEFSISSTKNRFTVVGCDIYAYISDVNSTFTTGSVLSCSNEMRFEKGASSGVGCCQTSFPKTIRDYRITLRSFNNYTKVCDFSPCGYAFIAKEGSFNFSKRELMRDLCNRTRFPVVVDWAVSNQKCREAQKDARSYACKQNSRCEESPSGIGYYCVCEDGFRGNPYLDTGCKDINECDRDNPYRGDGCKDGSCYKFPIIEISLGIYVGLLVIFTLVSTLCWGNKQRALKQLRRQYFEQDGALKHNLMNAQPLKLLFLLCTAAAGEAAQVKPSCNSMCGNVNIPYPFGTSSNCHIDDNHFINCTTTTNSSSSSAQPIAYLRHGNIKVLNISLDPPELIVSAKVSRHCYNSTKRITWNEMSLSKFSISNARNRFIVVGCDTFAFISNLNSSFATSCSLSCTNNTSFDEAGECSGVGCCQTSFPKFLRNYRITLGSYTNYTRVSNFTPCGYAFVAKNGSFNFSKQELRDLNNRTRFPVVVDWSVSNQNCSEAQKDVRSYACKQNSTCNDSLSRTGYYCVCKQGFRGNPYLDPGCEDINECEETNNCSRICNNFEGHYKCSCPWGYRGNGYKNGSGCKFPIIEIALGIFVGLLVIFTLVSTFCWGNKQRALKQLRRQYFEQNGGNYMLQQLHQQQGYIDRTKIFTEDELKIATNNFDESRILGRGGQGTVYKGILPDNSFVAIKKSKVGGDSRQVKDFINEVTVLSQINHRNVVKLFGCCLETEVPLLVYELVDNGTLLDHIDPLKNEHPLSWETRLRIAAETAEAISYLHSAASIPIIRRDIKSAKILLDHNHQAKVSDFGASRLVPLDETQVTTVVQETLGYLDPEYLLTGQLNEKSDVYSFGVVLVELITGNKAIEFNRPEQRNLAMYFASSMKEDNLWQILDKQVLDQKNAEQLKEVAFLARRCIRVNGEERPTMKEVAKELESLIAMKKHPWAKGREMRSEDCECFLGHVADGYGNASASTSATYDSIQKQLAIEIEDGR